MIVEKNINKTGRMIGFTILPFLIVLLLYPVYCNVRANRAYQEYLSYKGLDSDKDRDYYERLNLLISKAIGFKPGEPLYYSERGDHYFNLLEAGFGQELDIGQDHIVGAYKKAIELDSANSINYLKLGWFYNGRDNEEAQKFLNIAKDLNPSERKIYYYLAKHYLKVGEEKKAFSSILEGLNSINHNLIRFKDWGSGKWGGMSSGFLRELKMDEYVLKDIIYRDRKYFQFTFEPGSNLINFKRENFPHSQVPLTLRVQIKDDLAQVELLKDNMFFKKMVLSDQTDTDMSTFELNLDFIDSEAYLDQFSIKARSVESIDKVELVVLFFGD